jgi:hypothetical protein
MTGASSSKVQIFPDDQAYACTASTCTSSQRFQGTTHPGCVEWSRELEHEKIVMHAAHTVHPAPDSAYHISLYNTEDSGDTAESKDVKTGDFVTWH